MGIDPINSHTTYFGKSIGLNKRNVPINRTVSSNWNQRVSYIGKFYVLIFYYVPNFEGPQRVHPSTGSGYGAGAGGKYGALGLPGVILIEIASP